MKKLKTSAFTLIELLVVISIIAILAGIALPVFGEVMVRGNQTKALSNAKQVATACKLWAMDYQGNFPHYEFRTNPYGRAGRKAKEETPAYAYENEDQSAVFGSLRPGTRVKHAQFGTGTVISL